MTELVYFLALILFIFILVVCNNKFIFLYSRKIFSEDNINGSQEKIDDFVFNFGSTKVGISRSAYESKSNFSKSELPSESYAFQDDDEEEEISSVNMSASLGKMLVLSNQLSVSIIVYYGEIFTCYDTVKYR